MNKSVVAIGIVLLITAAITILLIPNKDREAVYIHDSQLPPDKNQIQITDTYTLPTNDGPISVRSYLGNAITNDGKVYVLVELLGNNPKARTRAPLNVALVIDKSGSMAGSKIEEVKSAARNIVNSLQASDIISLITYDTKVTVVLPAMAANNKYAIIDKINSIRASGNTNLYGGISEGYTQVSTFKSDSRINRVILLSDGLANVGIINPSMIANQTALRSNDGIGISTIGVGQDYNENLMVSIAERAGGNYYFINEPAQIALILERELNTIMQTVAKNITLDLQLPEGVNLIRIYGRPRYSVTDSPISQNNEAVPQKTVRILPYDLQAGTSSAYLLELKAERGNVSIKDLANVKINYIETSTNKPYSSENTMRVRLDPEGAVQDPLANREVLKYHTKYTLSEAHYVAADELDKGNNEVARSKLMEANKIAEKAQLRLQDKDIARQMNKSEESAKEVKSLGAMPAQASPQGRVVKKGIQAEYFNQKSK